ncbi:hypothetical protein LXL04_019561 [Taraxacum kok-saghyz]
MYDSDFELSDFEDGSSTSSERGFVVDEELEDSDPDVELKFCLTNYAVSNGYPICITKSSSFRLQAKCGFDKKGKRCPFKLWASWMGDELSFQGETSANGKEKMDADGRGNEKMDASVTEKGLHDIPVIMDFTNHKLAADLLRSGYSEDTIFQALDNEELHVDVEEEQKIAMVSETEEDEGVPETQSS